MWWTTMAWGTTLSVSVPRTILSPDEPVVLHVEVRNETERRVSIPRLDQPACALARWVEVSLQPGRARKVPECATADEKLAPGQRIRVELRLDDWFDTSRIETLTVRPREAFVPPAVSGSAGYWPGQTYAVVRRSPVATVEVEKGGTASLPAGVFGFLAHSHKRTYPGQTSPLMIAYTWTPEGGELLKAGASVYAPDGPEFDVGPYRFVLVDHVYGERMTLQVFTRETPEGP